MRRERVSVVRRVLHELNFSVTPHASEAAGNSSISFAAIDTLAMQLGNSSISFAAIDTLAMQLGLQKRVQKIVILTRPSKSHNVERVMPFCTTQHFVISQVAAREIFLTPPRIQALDCAGGVVRNTSAPIAVAINSNAGGGDLFGDSYTLKFSFEGVAVVTPVESQPFEVQKPASQLLFFLGSDPGERVGTSVAAGDVLQIEAGTNPNVEILDVDNIEEGTNLNVEILDVVNVPVTASIHEDPWATLWPQQHFGPSLLMGTTVVNAEGGLVEFTDLSIDKANLMQEGITGTFILKFQLNEFFVLTQRFSVKPRVEMARLFVFRQPERSVAGQALSVDPRVFVTDKYNNRLLPSDMPGMKP
ncbi:hypothetical protein T484DRAFT_1761743 [Baffinella frigidus]|nr:hypothetical protein T484DRAFT_1761743 [Cryptophyta sp. CCMP2293]